MFSPAVFSALPKCRIVLVDALHGTIYQHDPAFRECRENCWRKAAAGSWAQQCCLRRKTVWPAIPFFFSGNIVGPTVLLSWLASRKRENIRRLALGGTTGVASTAPGDGAAATHGATMSAWRIAYRRDNRSVLRYWLCLNVCASQTFLTEPLQPAARLFLLSITIVLLVVCFAWVVSKLKAFPSVCPIDSLWCIQHTSYFLRQ